jgi:chorismate mutase / prephenate dehydratase
MDELSNLRTKIDEIDDQILSALCERVKICKAIGAAKKKQGKPIRDMSRENDVFTRIRTKGGEFGLDAGQIEAVYREIVNMCSAVQE